MPELFSLGQIITEIDESYEASSAFTTPQKIRWINKEIREVWKEMALDDVFTMPTIKDVATYELPANIEFEMIRYLTVNGQSYAFRDDNQGRMPYTYYRVLDGQQGVSSYYGLYPVPNEDNLYITIGYWKRPVDLTEDDLAKVPDLRQDYLDVIIYGVLSRMAKIRQDVDLANNYANDKAVKLQQIKQERFENMPNYPVIRNTNPRSRRYVRGGRIAGKEGTIAWWP